MKAFILFVCAFFFIISFVAVNGYPKKPQRNPIQLTFKTFTDTSPFALTLKIDENRDKKQKGKSIKVSRPPGDGDEIEDDEDDDDDGDEEEEEDDSRSSMKSSYKANHDKIPVLEQQVDAPECNSNIEESLFDDTLFLNGVKIDFTFNESTTLKNDVTKKFSAPGCPKSIDGIFPNSAAPWVYYGQEPKCYLVGTRGPCPEGMKLNVEPESNWGNCVCNCYLSNTAMNEWKPVNETLPFCFDNIKSRHYTFVAEKLQCYPLLEKGPCEEDEWLVLDTQFKLPTCGKMPCKRISEKINFFDSATNSCKLEGTSCKGLSNSTLSSQIGTPIWTYGLDEFNLLPYCREEKAIITRVFLASVQLNDCINMDQVYSKLLGKCLEKSTKLFRSSGGIG